MMGKKNCFLPILQIRNPKHCAYIPVYLLVDHLKPELGCVAAFSQVHNNKNDSKDIVQTSNIFSNSPARILVLNVVPALCNRSLRSWQ